MSPPLSVAEVELVVRDARLKRERDVSGVALRRGSRERRGEGEDCDDQERGHRTRSRMMTGCAAS